METIKIRSALQDLIVRLRDAEKGYTEIKKAISNTVLREWMDRYAKERHKFYRKLEEHVADIGGEPQVHTSILGDLHRMFIDLKLNNMSDDYESIVNEIERGASQLIVDYREVLKTVELPDNIRSTLKSQLAMIQLELDEMIELRDKILAVEA